MQIKTGVKKMWVKIASINPFMTKAPIIKIPVQWFAEHSSPILKIAQQRKRK